MSENSGHVAGSSPHPDEAFVIQAMRELANECDGVVKDGCSLICDRDRKWNPGVLGFLEREGVRIIRTPFRAPNCNAYARRFVRSIKEECLDRVIPLGERRVSPNVCDRVVGHYEITVDIYGHLVPGGTARRPIDWTAMHPAASQTHPRRHG